jgi:hypothetical protein
MSIFIPRDKPVAGVDTADPGDPERRTRAERTANGVRHPTTPAAIVNTAREVGVSEAAIRGLQARSEEFSTDCITKRSMANNNVKKVWASGQGRGERLLAIRRFSAEVIAQCGFDSVTVDMQHGVQDYLSMCSVSRR